MASVADAQQGVVYVHSNWRASVVFQDSILLGKVTDSPFLISEGNHLFWLAPPMMDTWLVPRPSKQVRVHAGDTLHVVLNFTYTYRVESIPPEASVYIGDSLVGTTPLIFYRMRPLQEALVVEKLGFYPAYLKGGSKWVNMYRVFLEASSASGREARTAWWKSPVIDYLATGLTLSAAVLSIHFKFRADRLYERYLLTGAPELKARVRRYDIYAGWTLALAQVGLGIVTLRLVMR